MFNVFGRHAPIGLLLTAVGAVKFGLPNIWRFNCKFLSYFSNPWRLLCEWKLADFRLLFASVWHHHFRKIWQPCTPFRFPLVMFEMSESTISSILSS